MTTISAYLDRDHRHCDDLYVVVESDVGLQHWQAASAHFATFWTLFTRHIDKEERILFPRLDHALGNGYGATVVMRAEHAQMRATLKQMAVAIAAQDAGSFFERASHFRQLLRQHNLKEEGVLYPQADFVLARQTEAILASMRNLDHAARQASGRAA